MNKEELLKLSDDSFCDLFEAVIGDLESSWTVEGKSTKDKHNKLSKGFKLAVIAFMEFEEHMEDEDWDLD